VPETRPPGPAPVAARALTPIAVRPAAAEPARARIELHGAPPALTVTVDGAAAPLPLTLPRDGRTHEVRFRAPGYRELVRTVDADRERSLTLAMEAERRTPPPAPPPPR
jgi:hypothetical protein